MGVLRPGEFAITEDALKICRFAPEAALLDVGCGEGETVEYLQEKGFLAEGLDISKKMLEKGLARNPGLKLKEGEADFLDYSSYTFDGVFMECVLSLINMQTEALHEAYCVLKKGGFLIISDLYVRSPDPAKVKEMMELATAARSGPRPPGACETEHHELPSEYCMDGAFIKDRLIAGLEEIGYQVVRWKDETKHLNNFVAQAIFDHGSVEEYFKNVSEEEPECLCKAFGHKKLGYFLLVAKKPL